MRLSLFSALSVVALTVFHSGSAVDLKSTHLQAAAKELAAMGTYSADRLGFLT